MLAGLGAFLGLLFPLAIELSVIGFVLLFVGVLLTAPEADSPRPPFGRWWQALALAAFVFLIGLGLSFVAALPGGLMILVACVFSLVVVVLAWKPGPGGTGRTEPTP